MRLLSPLRLRAVALLWGGLAASAVGDQLGNVALAWIAVELFGPAAGYLAALQAGVTLIAALTIGQLIDGWNERWVMIGSDICRAAILFFIVALWEMTSHTAAPMLAGAVLVLAIGQAAFRPAVQTIMPNLAPPELLPAANALLDATERLARLVGPGLIILTAALLPVMHFLTIDAASFLASAIAVFAIGVRQTYSEQPRSSFKIALFRGFQAMQADRLLGFLLATSGINNGAWYAAMFLGLPLLLAQISQESTDGLRAFGAVIACYGATNLAGNLAIGNRSLPSDPTRLICCGIALNGVGILLIGVSVWLPSISMAIIFAGAALAGFGGPMSDIPRATLMQTTLPVGDITAAFRAWIVATSGGILIAMIIAPTLFAVLSASGGVALCGGMIAAVGLLGIVRRFDGARG